MYLFENILKELKALKTNDEKREFIRKKLNEVYSSDIKSRKHSGRMEVLNRKVEQFEMAFILQNFLIKSFLED